MRPDTVAASDEYNSRDFVKYSIGKLYEHYHYDAHIDTLYDGLLKQEYGMNNLLFPKITVKTKISFQKLSMSRLIQKTDYELEEKQNGDFKNFLD